MPFQFFSTPLTMSPIELCRVLLLEQGKPAWENFPPPSGRACKPGGWNLCLGNISGVTLLLFQCMELETTPNCKERISGRGRDSELDLAGASSFCSLMCQQRHQPLANPALGSGSGSENPVRLSCAPPGGHLCYCPDNHIVPQVLCQIQGF